MNKHPGGFLFLFTGLALGIGFGLLIAWVLSPVQFINTSPSSLRLDFKDEYRFMIASAYSANGDLARARARLDTIGDADPIKALGAQAQRLLANNSSMQVVKVLADLSEALQTYQTSTVTPSEISIATTPAQLAQITADTSPASTEQVNSTPTELATALAGSPEPEETLPNETDTPTPLPAVIPTLPAYPKPTATITPVPAFDLVQQVSLCEPSQPGLLQIYLSNSAGKPVAGVELVITWFGGEEHFFSGLKPEINPGYADYTLSDNVEYDLSISAAGTRVTGLRALTCTDASGGAYPGGIQLEFKQP